MSENEISTQQRSTTSTTIKKKKAALFTVVSNSQDWRPVNNVKDITELVADVSVRKPRVQRALCPLVAIESRAISGPIL
ncbi:hypothetical protein EVAR_65460_1 [Eumeta japonica]|uniref:Uncharacterized protein n=1 Tax=Eumeta variegata TaxID=151549 RepID=A0A4C1YR46_EUMVA|nr:hypothetical protein EVAR_65460_1 [Eumeta japonica]